MIPDGIYHVLTSWPMILVAIGTITLFKGEMRPTLILYSIAAYFLLPKIIPGLSLAEIWKFWPVLLIIIGLSIIYRPKKKRDFTMPEEMTSNDDGFDEIAVFGGRNIRMESQQFKGGKVTCIFGGSELQMTRCRMAGNSAVIEMTAIFSGVKMIIPREWNVKVEVVSIFGGFNDKRLYTQNNADNTPTLYIKGVTIFGGGELISY